MLLSQLISTQFYIRYSHFTLSTKNSPRIFSQIINTVGESIPSIYIDYAHRFFSIDLYMIYIVSSRSYSTFCYSTRIIPFTCFLIYFYFFQLQEIIFIFKENTRLFCLTLQSTNESPNTASFSSGIVAVMVILFRFLKRAKRTNEFAFNV